jgi:hypothetical protein
MFAPRRVGTDAAHGDRYGKPNWPAVEEILMIDPERCALMVGTTCRQVLKIDVTFTSNTRFTSALEIASVNPRAQRFRHCWRACRW